MKNKSKLLTLVLLSIIVLLYIYKPELFVVPTSSSYNDTEVTNIIIFPSERFPETAAHIKEAISHGESPICTIDRKGAEANRKESLKGIPTKPNLDRDEFPMAMCAEGGKGADIKYINPSDNRGAGSWVSNQLDKYKDGTKVKILVN
ncbi:NucA/NucB deoxyribonuclease domain-containing protein [Paenibacillus radicis (ex Xue et al. 2023)]|uniref:NucA/NucB deoxyribonuclease domain-containing protein n=1 Tax=Paenibacillus radicis (ex Xue et al. 2023) TaxID=2972489 RepID=A0ABT1YL40_9BACL|nr:NucA/NucB deoxyribonuclease domain-containing protein [Paenibacillus radicis (ex Xue et al. 2023)]MCR8633893.1 NucA/NucB deoxyribonuclease domain-containing protein [Paenibacillus radicis (ex Xue et al. 2023)]